ncbi:MAG: putative Ig domain-containing protein [Gammaproteobacteria bacterium]|nr:putative Ig domain-containing protein [Gammaproteobacteria bacterium]
MLVCVAALSLLAAHVSSAATLQLTTNQSSFGPGSLLYLSAAITPTNDAGQAVDLYVVLATPGGAILTLNSNLSWVSTLEPVARGFGLANLQVNNFYAMVLPAGVANGTYSFYLVAVRAGSDPANSNNWLGYSVAPFTFTGGVSAPGVELTTSNGTCTVNQYCNVALIAGVTGGSSPYSYRLDSLAYGTPPPLMTVDLLTGNLEGTPSLAGTYNFQICARDIGGNQDCQPVTVTVSQATTPQTQAWVFIGGDVSLLARITLDGVVIKNTNSSNLSHYMTMATGTHTLSATCTEVYCFSYLQLEPPSGYAFSPTELRATPEEIPPGATKTFTFTLTKTSN